MEIMFEWFRALHIIAVIFWMAGLLYLPRLYVYHSTAEIGGNLDAVLKIQERRLLKIIMTPAMLAALLFGIGLVWYRHAALFTSVWLPLKLILVFGLIGYHGFLSGMRKKFEAGERPQSEKYFRIINEIPPFLIIAIVILAVIEPF